MSSENRRGRLAAERVALDLYLDSLYEDVQPEQEGAAPVIALVPESPRRAAREEHGQEPRQGELQPRAQREGIEPYPAGAGGDSLAESDAGALRLLLLRLGGLNISVIASEVERVTDLPDSLLPAPQGDHLCLGMLDEGGDRVPVLDLAHLVLPERLRSSQAACSPGSLLLVASGSLGLACHGVEGVVSVAHDAINWRSERVNRKWLAGTVPELDSALLDTSVLQTLLAQGRTV